MTPLDVLAEALTWLVPDPRGPKGWMFLAAACGITGLGLALFLAWRHLTGDYSPQNLDLLALPMLLAALSIISAVVAAIQSPHLRRASRFWIVISLLSLASPWLTIYARAWFAA
jgi:hypothetical protein